MTALLLSFVLAVGAWASPARVQAQDPATELAAARQLYADAAYEQALDRLNHLNAPGALADQVDTYRALCLLALGRTQESERVIEQLLQRNPRYTVDEREVSPRLLIVFRAVKARLLPTAARNMYAAARASFDARQYEQAAKQFRDVIDLLQSATPDSGVGDLKMLAEGFLRQAEASTNGAAPATEVMMRAPGEPGAAPIYSILDRDVIAPVETSRPVPVMDTPRGGKAGLYQGLVEIVIGETGRVEQVAIRRSIHPEFDAQIIAATAMWRFQPATRNGKPVKYRRSYEVIGHSR